MTQGIHHITAIASDAKQCVHFYSHLLGLRLVKKTVNQDDVQTYHLFFGDKAGHPGMDLTFFIFQPAVQGKSGVGQVTSIALAVPEAALQFWEQRLTVHQVKHTGIQEHLGYKRIVFCDTDGLQLELVGSVANVSAEVWTTPEINSQQAIHFFHSATLAVPDPYLMKPILLDVLGYTPHTASTFIITDSTRANLLEIEETTDSGHNAAGTVHHIAFRAKDAGEQLTMREKVLQLGLYPTEVINRFYFQSVYFRTPAGILFEIATDGPGFTADESLDELGRKLALPPFLEPYRTEIEKNLSPSPNELTVIPAKAGIHH